MWPSVLNILMYREVSQLKKLKKKNIKIPRAFFTELEQIILNFVWKYKRPQIAETILRKSNRAVGITLPEFRLYCTVIRMAWDWHKNRWTDKQNTAESPEIKPSSYGQSIYDKRGKNIHAEKIGSSINAVGQTGQLPTKNEIRTFIL